MNKWWWWWCYFWRKLSVFEHILAMNGEKPWDGSQQTSMGYIGGCSLLWVGTHMYVGNLSTKRLLVVGGWQTSKLTTFLVAKLRIITVYETIFWQEFCVLLTWSCSRHHSQLNLGLSSWQTSQFTPNLRCGCVKWIALCPAAFMAGNSFKMARRSRFVATDVHRISPHHGRHGRHGQEFPVRAWSQDTSVEHVVAYESAGFGWSSHKAWTLYGPLSGCGDDH